MQKVVLLRELDAQDRINELVKEGYHIFNATDVFIVLEKFAINDGRKSFEVVKHLLGEQEQAEVEKGMKAKDVKVKRILESIGESINNPIKNYREYCDKLKEDNKKLVDLNEKVIRENGEYVAKILDLENQIDDWKSNYDKLYIEMKNELAKVTAQRDKAIDNSVKLLQASH